VTVMVLPDLVRIVIALALIGFLVWVLITYVPMPEAFRRLIVVVVIIAALLWLLRWVGLFA